MWSLYCSQASSTPSKIRTQVSNGKQEGNKESQQMWKSQNALVSPDSQDKVQTIDLGLGLIMGFLCNQ